MSLRRSFSVDEIIFPTSLSGAHLSLPPSLPSTPTPFPSKAIPEEQYPSSNRESEKKSEENSEALPALDVEVLKFYQHLDDEISEGLGEEIDESLVITVFERNHDPVSVELKLKLQYQNADPEGLAASVEERLKKIRINLKVNVGNAILVHQLADKKQLEDALGRSSDALSHFEIAKSRAFIRVWRSLQIEGVKMVPKTEYFGNQSEVKWLLSRIEKLTAKLKILNFSIEITQKFINQNNKPFIASFAPKGLNHSQFFSLDRKALTEKSRTPITLNLSSPASRIC